jgi:hypothetical protein
VEASAAGEEEGIGFFRVGHRRGEWRRWVTEEEGRRVAAAQTGGGSARRGEGQRQPVALDVDVRSSRDGEFFLQCWLWKRR